MFSTSHAQHTTRHAAKTRSTLTGGLALGAALCLSLTACGSNDDTGAETRNTWHTDTIALASLHQSASHGKTFVTAHPGATSDRLTYTVIAKDTDGALVPRTFAGKDYQVRIFEDATAAAAYVEVKWCGFARGALALTGGNNECFDRASYADFHVPANSLRVSDTAAGQ